MKSDPLEYTFSGCMAHVAAFQHGQGPAIDCNVLRGGQKVKHEEDTGQQRYMQDVIGVGRGAIRFRTQPPVHVE
uniref:Uncharacterized protein n=1 Tax=Anopheles albimanus TaxID=7167 RepID=A0A182FXU1_ANOAL